MNTLQGVNLGGWLVLEKWITPSLFSGTTAKNHFQLEMTSEGRARVKSHLKTFINEADIRWLKAQGVELLRVPFGFWLFGDQDVRQASIERLDWLVRVAKKYDLQLLLDMHGAAGSQNNRAHSGGLGASPTLWLDNIAAQQKTIDIVLRVAERYRNEPHIWGIQLLNEPSIDVTGLKLVDFYRRAYRELVKVARPGTRIVFSDGFRPLLTTNAFGWSRHRNFPVLIDTHIYYCFGENAKRRDLKSQLLRARLSRWYIRALSLFQPVIVGEWSAMLPYRISDDAITQFIHTQQKSYKNAEAWCYWTYKTESSGRWNFRDMVEKGHFNLLQ